VDTRNGATSGRATRAIISLSPVSSVAGLCRDSLAPAAGGSVSATTSSTTVGAIEPERLAGAKDHVRRMPSLR